MKEISQTLSMFDTNMSCWLLLIDTTKIGIIQNISSISAFDGLLQLQNQLFIVSCMQYHIG